MTLDIIPVIHTYYMRGSEKLQVGRLALKEHKVCFEYDSDFLKTGLELSPFKLPLKPGIIVCEDRLFNGLFGVFNDSLPDGWGRLLLDRKFKKSGINLDELSPLDRLRYVANRGMGALVYESEAEDAIPAYCDDLDEIAGEVRQFQENNDDHFIDALLAMSGSIAGARPKIMMSVHAEDWLIKFCSSIDLIDIGPIEYAYHLMAKAAHLDVPPARLFPSKKGPGFFGVKRFDRIDGKRVHMHTLSGLLHADHRMPSLDYQTVMKATLWLTKNIVESERQFRAAVFNILAHNRDDHAKNFSFLMDQQGMWRISPAYDLTFSAGPAGEHCTIVMGEGKNPTLSHLLKLAEVGQIKKEKALRIIDDVKDAVLQWHPFAKDAHVSKTSHSMVQAAINLSIKNVFG